MLSYQSEWPKRVFWTGNEWDQTMSSGIFEVAKYVEIGFKRSLYLYLVLKFYNPFNNHYKVS